MELVSQDPIGFAAGDTNVSRYVGNGVTGAVDPSGLKKPGSGFNSENPQWDSSEVARNVHLRNPEIYRILRRAIFVRARQEGARGVTCEQYRNCEVMVHVPASYTTSQLTAYVLRNDRFLRHLLAADSYARTYPRGDERDPFSPEAFRATQVAALREAGLEIESLMRDVVRELPGGEGAIFLYRAADGDLQAYVGEAQAIAALGRDAVGWVGENPGKASAVAGGVLLGMNIGRRAPRGGWPSSFGNQFPNEYPNGIIPAHSSVRRPSQLLRMRGGMLDYVVLEDGTLVMGILSPNEGHANLAGGARVRAAGQIRVSGGRIIEVDNASGHYLPVGPNAQNSAVEALQREGFTVGNDHYVEKAFNEQSQVWEPVDG